MAVSASYVNPFRPGAGHMPPYLAGRSKETDEFHRLLEQTTILENMVLTGLRGVGKTVLLDTFKPIAMQAGWLWVGTDLSESTSISETRLATRLITDLAVVTSSLSIGETEAKKIGFQPAEKKTLRLEYDLLTTVFNQTPGLVSDKLKKVLTLVWQALQDKGHRGIIFAYDEAQNLSDHAGKDEFPLSLILDLFQSIQKMEIPFMLALTGLPTLFPKLVEARTFAERMFRVLFLNQLKQRDCRDAITKPIQDAGTRIQIQSESIDTIVEISGGYPYFIQFICREVYDSFIQQEAAGKAGFVPVDGILRKLDTDFFSGRWSRATDRQRELLTLVADLPNCESEFSIQEVVEKSKESSIGFKPFGSSHVSQMMLKLTDAGLVYKNRHGKYSFAVPLFSRFIQRQAPAKEQGLQRKLPFSE